MFSNKEDSSGNNLTKFQVRDRIPPWRLAKMKLKAHEIVYKDFTPVPHAPLAEEIELKDGDTTPLTPRRSEEANNAAV